jgi:flagellar hook-length control protein FliK
LRQWADGERSLVQIRQEPQNQSKAGAVAGAVIPVDKDRATVTAQQLLPAQLDALENRRFAWEGELWPGQPLQFEISEDKHESNAKQQASPDGAWQTVVRFQLPHLGQVNATISLQGEHVQVHVDVQNEAAASLLKTAGEQLTLSLSASGTALDKLTVQDLAAS